MKPLLPKGLLVAGAALAAAILAWSQIVPGQLPPTPPTQPGQIADDVDKPTDKTQKTKAPDPNAPAKAPDDKPTFQKSDIIVSTTRVIVPTTVLDPSAKDYVTDLTTKDFEVYDNDTVQKIDTDLVQQPLSVVLAVQANSEVEGFLPKLRNSARLLNGLVTGVNGDIAILAFDHRMQLLQDFTSDPDKLDDAMHKLRAGSSSSAIIDAVLESDHMLRRHDRDGTRRRVIVLLSRDINKGSQAKLNETIRDLQFDNITIYCVDISKTLSAITKDEGYPRPAHGGIPAEGMPAPIAGGGVNSITTDEQNAYLGNGLELVPPLLRSIHDLFKKPPARAFTYFTGGLTFNFATEHGLEKAVALIGKDLNSQYVLSYPLREETKKEPGFHKIVVTVDRPGLKIRTRPGYWWGGGEID